MLSKLLIKSFTILILLIIYPFKIQSSHNEKFVIGAIGHGFFSSFNHIISNLLYADRHNKIPVIDFSIGGEYGRWIYEQIGGYNNSTNPWEYYFEPVSNSKYEPGDYIHNDHLTLDGRGILYNRPNSYRTSIRNTANNIIKKYIKIKPNIQIKINQFYNDNMHNKITIGIHLRGTDKKIEIPQVTPEIILQTANEFAKKMGDHCQFFVATDEERLLTLAKSTLNRKVIYYNSTRSQNGTPIHLDPNIINKAVLGEEILIEAKLLSLCDLFIHTLSHVSQAVSYFNPNLQMILLNPPSYSYRFRQLLIIIKEHIDETLWQIKDIMQRFFVLASTSCISLKNRYL